MRTVPAIVLRLLIHWPNSGSIWERRCRYFWDATGRNIGAGKGPWRTRFARTRRFWEPRCGRLISRFRNAMAQKLGQAGFPSGDPSQEFSEAVEIARATWNWESGQLLGTDTAAGDWRGIFTQLSSIETAAPRLRDWARVLRQPSVLRQLGPRAMLAAARVGSLATLIYGTGCVIDFFWDEIGSGQGRGSEMAAELCRTLAVEAQDSFERRRLLTRTTLGAWERHLRFAAA